MEKQIKNWMRRLGFLSLLCAFSIISCNASESSDSIRVAILKDQSHVWMSVRGRYRIVDPKTKKVLLKENVMKRTLVLPKDGGIQVGAHFYPHKTIEFQPSKDLSVLMGNKLKRFRGAVDFVLDKKNTLLVINTIDLEQYIKGVLYHETSHKWPMAALKAQAVAARTYAVYQKEQNNDKVFDVTSNIYSQVYGGRSAERYRTNLAVDRTKKEVLLYRGEILPAYYHSHCGGHTEDVRELWDQDEKPLRGVACRFCRSASLNNWKKNFRSSDVQQKLNQAGIQIGLIKDIRIVEKNTSGRNRTLRVTDRSGKSRSISGKDFRNIIGPNELRSNKYDIQMKGYYFDVLGKGWGHGVGMCQWGAFYMSKKRYKYHEILKFYYPGIKIDTLDKLREDRDGT